MSLRVGILSAAHVHAPSFVACFLANPGSDVVGVWDDNTARGQEFAAARNLPFHDDLATLLTDVDAVVICSENLKHADHIEAAARAGKAILCEKPIAASEDQAARIEAAVSAAGVPFMTAFPCPFSPAFQAALTRVQAGEIGSVLALSTTNQGTCPFGWFVEPELSGGGAMIDHTVHVADLLRRLLGSEATNVSARTGNNMYEKSWDDTAMLTVEFPSGVFATIDASWSKPSGYRTWGNVKLNIVGEKGVIELDLFAQGSEIYGRADDLHRSIGSGSNLDALMVAEFIAAVREGRAPAVTLADGLAAARIALAAYRSAADQGEPVLVA